MTWTFRNIAFGCALALAVVMLLLASALITSTSRLHHTAHNMKVVTQNLLETQELESNILVHSRESLLWYLTTDDSHLETRESAKVIFENWLEQAKSDAVLPSETVQISRIERSAKDYFEARAEAEKEDAQAATIAKLISPTTDNLLTDIEDFSKLILGSSNDIQQRAFAGERKAILIGGATITAALIGLAVVLLLLRYHVYVPLTQIVESIKHLGSGGTVKQIRTRVEDVSIIWQSLDDSVKKIQRQKDMQLRYLAAVAHDLRNPIGAITSSARLLAEDAGSKPECKEMLEIINRQVGYLNNMVTDLLDTTRVEAGALSLKKDVSDLRVAVREAANLFRGYSLIHSIVFQEPQQPVLSNFDSVRMSQVMNNIISNAVKYSPFGGIVYIKLEESGPNAVIKVRDTGIGISEDEKQTIFEPFRRSASTINTIPGVGLGLFTAQKIIASHQGSITVESIKGEGTTFIITLPMAVPSNFLPDQPGRNCDTAYIPG